MRFSEYFRKLYESLWSLRLDKKYTRIAKQAEGTHFYYKNVHKEIFGNNYRIYIPFKIENVNYVEKNSSYDEINRYLNNIGYKTYDYLSGIALKKEIKEIDGKRKEIIRKISIGKLLQRKITEIEKEIMVLREEISNLLNIEDLNVKEKRIIELSELLR